MTRFLKFRRFPNKMLLFDITLIFMGEGGWGPHSLHSGLRSCLSPAVPGSASFSVFPNIFKETFDFAKIYQQSTAESAKLNS